MSEIEKLKSASSSGRLKFIAKDTVVYGGAVAVSRMLYVFIIPLLARVLTKDEYGVVDGLTVLSLVFGLIIIFGQDSAVARFFYEADDEETKRNVVTNAFFIQLFFSVFITAGLFFYAEEISTQYLGRPGYSEIFKVMALTVPFASAVQFFQNLLKWVFLRKQFIMMAIGFTISFLLLTLLFVLHYDYGIEGVFYAKFISSVAFSLLGFWYCRKYFTVPKKFKYSTQLMSYGWPFMLIGVFGALVPSVDRYFITDQLGLEVMAVYAIGFRVSSLLKLPVAGFQMAWGPFAFAIYKEDNADETYNNVLRYYTILLVLLGLATCLLAEPIILIFASAKYAESSIVIVPLIFSVIVDSLSWITSIGIGISKKTYHSASGYFIGLLATVGGILLLIEPYGIVGVAFAVLIGRTVLTITLTLLSHKVYPIKFDLVVPTLIVSLGFGLSILSQEFTHLGLMEQVSIRFGLFVVFCTIIWFKLMSAGAKKRILQILNKNR